MKYNIIFMLLFNNGQLKKQIRVQYKWSMTTHDGVLSFVFFFHFKKNRIKQISFHFWQNNLYLVGTATFYEIKSLVEIWLSGTTYLVVPEKMGLICTFSPLAIFLILLHQPIYVTSQEVVWTPNQVAGDNNEITLEAIVRPDAWMNVFLQNLIENPQQLFNLFSGLRRLRSLSRSRLKRR